jgi:hypothetical protein
MRHRKNSRKIIASQLKLTISTKRSRESRLAKSMVRSWMTRMRRQQIRSRQQCLNLIVRKFRRSLTMSSLK